MNCLILDEIIKKIVYYTNLRISEENPVTANEIKSFIGLLILFGLTKKSDVPISEIWSDQSIHFLPLATTAMSRSRFKLLASKITFDNINLRSTNKGSKFDKFEEIFNLFKKNIKLIIPSNYLCIDEALNAFRGKCQFRQYMPNKPSRYGIKFWCLVDVLASYMVDIDIYLGKVNGNAKKESNVGEKVVLKLVEPFFNTYRYIVNDKFLVV